MAVLSVLSLFSLSNVLSLLLSSSLTVKTSSHIFSHNLFTVCLLKGRGTVVPEDFFPRVEVIAVIHEEATAQCARRQASHALHEGQQAKRPKQHIDRGC